jgi:hypothetical protein
MATSNAITLNTNEARIILDWAENNWYVSSVDYHTDITVKAQNTTSTAKTTNSTGGVKTPEWDGTYKYNSGDIVAYKGIMYVSKQNQNQDNAPDSGNFWWNNIINLSAVDAITLEGKNIKEIIKEVLGGNLITDYYKKLEVENLLVDASNSVNAKRLDNLSLEDLRKEYNTLSDKAKAAAIAFTLDYLNSDLAEGFDQMLANTFNANVLPDTINKP